jgi:hypothetical protein
VQPKFTPVEQKFNASVSSDKNSKSVEF